MNPNLRTHISPKRGQQRGSSIIEVLVAALILSLGMLALVGVQASSTQISQLNQMRADASRLAQSYTDRIRANQGTAQANIANYAIAGAYTGATRAAITVPANCTTPCLDAAFTTQVTAIDIAQMRNQARLALPNGDFRVQVQNVVNVGTVVDVWVMWVQATTVSENGTTNTVGGLGCPTNLVAAGTVAQCYLSRVVL